LPNYSYGCRDCDRVWDKFNTIANRNRGGRCDCGGMSEKRITGFANNTFRSRWFESIDSKPVYVESQSQLDTICKRTGCYIEKDDRKKQKAYYDRHGMVEEGKRLYQGG